MKSPIRLLVYLGSFILPILLVGEIGSTLSMAITMAGAPETVRAAVSPQPAPAYIAQKPTVAIVLGDLSEVTDVLGPYALFADSGAYNVYTVAATRDLRTLTEGLDVVPHYSFAELEAQLGHNPDIVVVPAMPNIQSPENKPVLDWLKQQAQQRTILFSWCTGAEVLAASGVLDGKAATTHWADIDRLERTYPAVQWQRGVRYVDQGRLLTSAGLTSGIDATLHLLTRLQGAGLAEQVARHFHYASSPFVDHPEMPQYQIEPADSIYLLNTAFNWPKQRAGVWLYNGVGELDLAAVFDVYAASGAGQVYTVAADRSITSQHGLQLIPRWHTPQLPTVERVLVPGGTEAEQVSVPAQVGAPITTLANPAAPMFAVELTLEEFARTHNVPTARFAAKRLEYRADSLQLNGAGWPLQISLLPLLIGSLGLGGAHFLINRRWNRRGINRQTDPKQRSEAAAPHVG